MKATSFNKNKCNLHHVKNRLEFNYISQLVSIIRHSQYSPKEKTVTNAIL